MWVIVVPVLHLLGLISAFRALMETRTSQGTIAWVIFLVSFPYVALPVYWIFGRNRFVGYCKADGHGKRNVRESLGILREEMERFRPGAEKCPDHPGAVAEKLADLPITGSNAATLLIDGEETFRSILEGITKAQHYVLVQFYIVNDDGVGRELQRRLVQKASEGIRVFFLYDEIGSYSLNERYLDILREAGVEVSAFNSRRGWWNKFQLNFRNHRKVVISDGRTAWIGGHNVGDEYLGKDPKIGRWRDTHLMLEGPAVMGAQLSFAEDWFWATGEKPDGLIWTPRRAEGGTADVLVIPSGPADEVERAELMFLHAINMAEKRLWIASPYFVPDDAVVYALQLAGMRGVDVRILIPDRPDHLIVWLAAYSYFEEAGKTGVRFYRYSEGFLHEKVMLVDRRVATVGTANFDNRSFRLNFEITAVVEERAFVEKVEAMFLEDFKKAQPESSGAIRRRPFWFRIAVRLARLSAPIQ